MSDTAIENLSKKYMIGYQRQERYRLLRDAIVELLAGINYSEDLIKMYLHDDILKESVTYQRILNDGGKQEAIVSVFIYSLR